MAASATTSTLGSIIQGHLECSICHTLYQEPKILNCSHSFCLRCLQELKKRQNPQCDKITCPLCQRETILPEGGVTKLNNYTLISLVEEVTKQEQLLKGEGSKECDAKVICQACDEENEAIFRCIDCEQFLCLECQKAHQRFKAMKSHTVASLLQEKESASKTESKNISKCEFHPKEKRSSYCNTCEELACKLCVTSSHKGSMHTLVDLDFAVDICLQEASEKISEVCKCKHFNNATSWESLRNRLGVMLVETNSQISKNAEKKIKQIRQEEKNLKQMAKAAYRRKDKKLAEMVFAKETLKMAKNRTSQANPLGILKLRQEVLQDHKDAVVEKPEDLTRDLSFIGFKEKEDEELVGTLLLEEKWTLMETSKNVFGRFVLSLSTGDILVVNKAYQKLTKLSPNGKVLHTCTVGQLDGEDLNTQTYPTAIAVNKDDELIILLESECKIFNREYQLLHQFTPGDEAGIYSTPTCLAVDDSNLIAMGYKDREQVSLHNPDGSHIRTLPAPMIGEYLTISNQHLIYTTGNVHTALTRMDYEGNQTLSVSTAKNTSLSGVCCNKAGDIYVLARCKKDVSDVYQIHHYDADGCYIGTLFDDLGYTLARPTDITYTQEGKLAVSGAGFTKIYHRVQSCK